MADDKGKVHVEQRLVTLTEKQKEWSRELSSSFPDYINALRLKDETGNPLLLNKDGNGSFKEYMKKQLILSAQKEVHADVTTAERLGWKNCSFTPVKELPYLEMEGDLITGLDWDAYIGAITRMKIVPAFDQPDLSSPENEEFGTEEERARHFTAFGFSHTEADGNMAEESIIRMMNPVAYVRDPRAVKARHWWIRHGSYDRDTSLAVPAILSLLLKNAGLDVDFLLPWGLPHSGDYDLTDLFDWIDSCCKG